MRKISVYICFFLLLTLGIWSKQTSGVNVNIPSESKYKITSYASVKNSHALIYSIEDSEGRLIMVDGGWEEDAGLVREIIGGREVEGWILTHPHPDHIGAFNSIYAEGNCEIKKIYANPVDYDKYQETASEHDQFSVYERFLALTKDEEINYLSAGDKLEIIGLEIEVFNSFDFEKMTKAGSDNRGNDGSLMFKVSSEHSSMLFCGDVGAAMSSAIIEQFGTRLKSDFVQMGHHGNGGSSETLYRIVQPKAAFFDAPDWLIEGKEFNTQTKMQLMRSMGSEILTYESAPNSVYLD